MIPYVETGNKQGTYKSLSVMYALLVVGLTSSYVYLTYYSKNYTSIETTFIATLAGMNTLAYIIAITQKPNYAPKAETQDQDDEFLEILKRI